MNEPVNGFDALRQLKEANGKPVQNFRDFTRYLEMRSREKGAPIHGQFELTPLCNFDCRMCYVHLDPDQMRGRGPLPVETWKDLMRQAADAGMLEATLTGGECLTYPGFDELFLFLQSLGCEVSVMTNGYLLDEKRIAFFRRHKPRFIQVTMYGSNDDVYERVTGRRVFSRVSENIRNAVEAGLPLWVIVTPNEWLGEDALETVRAAKGLCKIVVVNSSIFDPRPETGRSGQLRDPDVELYTRLYLLLREMDGVENREIPEESLPPIGGPSHECAECGLRCGGGRSSFVIDWQGTLTACNRLRMLNAKPLAEGFRAAWEKVNQQAKAWPRVPECEGCAYADACDNCAANMLQYAEPGKQPLALCERARYYVRHGVRQVPGCG